MDQKVEEDIKLYGCHLIHVVEDETGPAFSYSIGLYESYGHPEIIFIGLKRELTHSLINDMASDIKEGKRFNPYFFYDDIISSFKCYITQVEEKYYDEYVGQAQNYYNGNSFPVLQCIYPTVKGVYPWEDMWPEEIIKLQPILGEIKPLNQL